MNRPFEDKSIPYVVELQNAGGGGKYAVVYKRVNITEQSHKLLLGSDDWGDRAGLQNMVDCVLSALKDGLVKFLPAGAAQSKLEDPYQFAAACVVIPVENTIVPYFSLSVTDKLFFPLLRCNQAWHSEQEVLDEFSAFRQACVDGKVARSGFDLEAKA